MSGKVKGRIAYIDALRGTAVVAMFYVHSASAWLAPSSRSGTYWNCAMKVSGMVAPVFMFLAGFSVFMAWRKTLAESEALSNAEARAASASFFKNLAVRGLKIIAIGYGLHFALWMLRDFSGPLEKALRVDILHAIGLSLIVLPLPALSKSRFNWRALALFAALPLLGQVIFRLSLEKYIPAGLSGYLTLRSPLGLFPLIPYGAWFCLGLFVAPVWEGMSGRPRGMGLFVLGLVAAAAAMYLVSKGVKSVYYSQGLDSAFGPPMQNRGLTHVFFKKGAVVLALLAAFQVLAALCERPWAKPLRLLGGTSLFAYCAHLILVYSFLGRAFYRSLGPAEQVLAAVVLGGITLSLSLLWSRRALALKAMGLRRDILKWASW